MNWHLCTAQHGKARSTPYWGMNGVSELSDPTFIRGIKDRRELAPTKSWQCIRTKPGGRRKLLLLLLPLIFPLSNPSCVLRRSGWPWTPLITKIPPSRDWLGHVLQYYPDCCCAAGKTFSCLYLLISLVVGGHILWIKVCYNKITHEEVRTSFVLH